VPVPSLVGVIGGLLHPPIDLLHLEAHAGNPHSGSYSPLRVRGVRNVDAHGVFWNVIFAPPGYGLTVDNVGNHYDRPVVAFREFEQLLDLTLVSSPLFESREAQGIYMLYGEVPQALNIEIAPGVTIDFSWLVMF
jgi:hypothetical protein